MTIRLVAIDEHVLLRLGLARVAAGCQDVELAGEASTIAEATGIIAETGASVITIDAMLGGGDGIAGACRLRSEHPDLGIVVLSPVDDDALLYRALDASLSAYLTKASPASAVLAAIRHAAVAPHSFTAPGLASALDRRRGQHGLLSQREGEVLALMRDGRSLPSIAQEMHVSEATVKTYVSRLYSKLRVNNRSQALMVAVNRGLLASVDAA
ncbi:MAG: response regulator transcription factor [Dactylosporangium sp.]|nr:response regulator transcription factor [Dactylosporangium sp.]NNJ63154.1 response regulator transcription factor [Dactylosporangium sp.]